MGYLFRAEQISHRLRLTATLESIERMISEFDQPLTAERGANIPVADRRCDFVTASPVVERIKKQVSVLANADLPLLLMGETGVGKDQMARYFHSLARPNGPYIAVNCASVPATLLESELFGHKRGAFTGADADRVGRFTAADGGVLFLDEIGEMDVALQAKLLGVLERRKVLPLGSTKEIDLDIKLVAATNKDLEKMVETGLFRRDLYYRLSGISFVIPPLRERKEDIPLLLEKFMAEHGMTDLNTDSLDPDLVRQFVAYDWPGNVRELLNKVKRLEAMKLMATENDMAELVRLLFAESPHAEPLDTSLFDRLEQFERKLITEALIAARGNKSQTARMLGVHEATVRMKLKRYGLVSLSDFPPSRLT
jgi:two-component system NtrC family response regulator